MCMCNVHAMFYSSSFFPRYRLESTKGEKNQEWDEPHRNMSKKVTNNNFVDFRFSCIFMMHLFGLDTFWWHERYMFRYNENIGLCLHVNNFVAHKVGNNLF